MCKCWFCGSDLVWEQDFTFEDYDIYENPDNTVAVLHCTNQECGTLVECYNGFCKTGMEDEE